MTQVPANGIRIEYEDHGDPSGAAIILARGLGTQLIDWPDSFLDGLKGLGLRVITFDNRDVGLSEKLDAGGTPDLAAVAAGKERAPYTLEDMAEDVVGLMDALDISRAHVLGISMGGMIAQVLAARHGERLLSMTSVMSSSGRPGLPAATPEAMASLTAEPDPDGGVDAIDELVAEGLAICGSPAWPQSLEERLAIARRRRERNHHPAGVTRQMAAVIATGSRVGLLESIRIPCLVIHGADDPLIPSAAGEDTARTIPDCRLRIIPGMGHNIPEGVVPVLIASLSEFYSDLPV